MDEGNRKVAAKKGVKKETKKKTKFALIMAFVTILNAWFYKNDVTFLLDYYLEWWVFLRATNTNCTHAYTFIEFSIESRVR